MTLYPSVWPLPYGITIPKERSPEYTYSIPRSQTQCWEVIMADWQQVRITAVHNSIIGNQNLTIRAWMSIDPNGPSIIQPISVIPSTVNLTVIGTSWTFYKTDINPEIIEKSDIVYPIDNGPIHYFNIQNCENKDNSYYLRFTFMRDGTTLDA